MHTVTIYGASDDLIEVEGTCSGCDEYNEDGGSFVLTGERGVVRLRVRYTDGVWAIEVAPVDEDTPALPVAITAERYSARAVIEGVTLVVHEAA